MRRNFMAAIGIMALLASFVAQPSSPAAAKDSVVVQQAKGQIPPAVIHTGSVTRKGPSLSAGVISGALDDLRAEEADQASSNDGSIAAAGPPGADRGTLGCSQRNKGDNGQGNDESGNSRNVRVNQDCTFRRQAEESIIYNPADPSNLTAGQNDSRVGYNQCGIDWSLDNGQHWGDMLPPFRQKINNPQGELPTPGDPNSHTILGDPGTLHTYDFASDPGVAFDSQGNAFFDCVALDVFSNASMFFVVRSPATPVPAKGSFYYNIPSFSRRYIVDEDNNPAILNDKPFITADKYVTSPNRDNVYVTWTVFRYSLQCGVQPAPPAPPVEQYCASPIFGSMSTDHGQTWSTPEEISGTSSSLCFFGNFFQPGANPNACDFNQGSDPTALPNGDLEVIFNNGNTAANNPNAQQLGVHCHPTGSSPAGTAHLNCAAPAKVGDDVSSGEPLCNFGRGPEECIPGAYIRTNDFPRINQNAYNGHLYATWQDYRNGEFDIQLSQSTDGGLTWHEVGTVNPDRGLDHYFPAVEISPSTNGQFRSDNSQQDSRVRDDGSGDRVGDSYYRTERVPNENTVPTDAQGNVIGFGCSPGTTESPPGSGLCTAGRPNSDYVLAGGSGAQTPYVFKVISPAFAPPDGIQTGFNGDYSGLTINRGTEAHPIWSDTRNVNPYPENGVVHDEDIFTDALQLPNGRAQVTTGRIGQGQEGQ